MYVYTKKTQIIDVFVILISFTYLYLLSYILFLFIKDDLSNYYILYILDRIILFIPFILNKEFNQLYKNYCKLWNRNDNEKRSIKSITLRNISLIIMNISIFILNIAIINIS